MRLTWIATIAIVLVGAAAVTPSAGQTAAAQPAASESMVNDDQISGVGFRLVEIPEATQNDSRTETAITDRVDPGSTIQRRMEVMNASQSRQTVHIYSGAAHITDGVFVGESNPSNNVLTDWITFDTPELIVEPESNAYVTVTISVPSDAEETELYAVMWAEVRGRDGDGGANIVQASRGGIRVLLSVGPGNGPPADFSIGAISSARDDDGFPTVSAIATNDGGRAVDISGDLSLTNGPGGLSAGPLSAQGTTTLAPGDSGEVVFTLSDELPNGPWDATLALKSGLVEREASATITFPDAGVGETVAPNESPVLFITLVSSGAVLLLLAAATFWWLHRRRATALAVTPAVSR